jgi:GNAT superfamily N-acetyltransferase
MPKSKNLSKQIEKLTNKDPQSTGPTLLDKLVIKHGPPEVLGPFFAKTYRAALDRGITLSFGSLNELAIINEQNRKNWMPLVPVFDPRFGGVTPDNSFCVIGRTALGKVVAAHAARIFEWKDTNFVEELKSLRLFYSNPQLMQQSGEVCSVSADLACEIKGRVVYSGAAWVHPDYRGRGLTAILPKFAKAYAYTRWQPHFIASLMTEAIHSAGFFHHFCYQKLDWEARLIIPQHGQVRFAVVWMNDSHLFDQLSNSIAPRSEIYTPLRYGNT